MEVENITDKLGSLTLWSPDRKMGEYAEKTQADVLDEPSITEPELSLLSSKGGSILQDNSEEDDIYKIKNENYHLKLALNEKEEELITLRKSIREGAYLESVHYSVTSSNRETLYYPTVMSIHSPTKLSTNSDCEVLTHFSASPYKGYRTKSTRTESSLATTTDSKINKNHNFFVTRILPFIEKNISILGSSYLFQEDAQEIEAKYQEFLSPDLDKDYKLKIMNEVLEDILFLQRQNTSCLNRELQFKQLSQRLEFLFTIFLDPTEYNLAPYEHIERLKNDIMDTLFEIFDYNEDVIEQNRILTKRPGSVHKRNWNLPANKEANLQKLQNLSKGIDLCAQALSNNTTVSTTQEEEYDSLPSTRNSASKLSSISQFSNKEKTRLKQSRNSLEFYPIGYDEQVLISKTPQRNTTTTYINKSSSKQIDMTPDFKQHRREDENDPLQQFFSEQTAHSQL